MKAYLKLILLSSLIVLAAAFLLGSNSFVSTHLPAITTKGLDLIPKPLHYFGEDKLLHCIGFAGVAFSSIALTLRQYRAATLLVVVGFACLTEAAQGFTATRTASFFDLTFNFLGILSGLLCYNVFRAGLNTLQRHGTKGTLQLFAQPLRLHKEAIFNLNLVLRYRSQHIHSKSLRNLVTR